jgi:hypothetical protein
MSLGKRLIGAGAGVVCNTDSVQAFGVDNAFSSNIALYQLDGNANDTTGDYNGTATDVTYSTGQFGQAAVFNGSSSRIIVEDSTANAFGFANHIGAIGAWINVDSLSTNNVIAAKRDFGAPGNRHWIFNIETSGQIRFLIYNTDSNAQTVLSSSSISVNQWYHIAVTLTTSDVKIYINGVEDTTASSTYSTIQNGGADLQIGRRGTNSGYNYFDGKIDQLRIFNRGITPQEVSTLYNESTSTASNINPLSDGSGVALYTLDYDASDAGGLYDGTPTNVEFGVGGQINYGARFNGSVGGIEITNVNNLIQNEIESFSFWFKDRFILLFCDPSSATSTDRRRWLIDNNLASGIKMQVNNDQYNYENTSTNTQDGQWHHLAVSSDGYIYLDGTALSTQFSTSYWLGDGSNGSSRDTIRIGTGDYIGAMTNSSVIGSFDQFRIFNKALSSSEVSTLYAETACVYTCTTDTVDYPTTNVAYYKLDNSAEDETGSYDGTESNIEYRFGRFGQAAVFNGSSSYIDTNYNFGTDSSYSISIWMNTTVTSTRHFLYGVWVQSGADYGPGIVLGINASNNFEFFVGNGSSYYNNTSISASSYTDGNWHNLVLVINGTNIKLYADGNTTPIANLTSTVSAGTSQSENLVLGRLGDYPGTSTGTGLLYYNGKLDQVRIYSTALDSDQVSQLYNEKPCADTSNFKTVLYEGNGSTQYISNVGMDLETDGGLVWVKKRDAVHDHKLADSVRGATKIIESSTADAEITATGSINAFNANGFEVGSDSSVNGNGNDFVAWVWKGGGDAVSNTNGDITSQVSANTDAGFSIVKYSGNTGANQTVGHGLSSTPEMVIVKRLTDSGYSWCVQHTGLTSMGYNIYLDDTLGELLRNRITAWNSTTFTVEQIHETNNTGEDYIAYCFHSVSGYSKIGSYTGAGSGTRVYTTSDGTSTGTGGFKPSWIMLKNASVGGTNYDWYIYDVRRNDNDGDDNIESYLRANLSSAEVTSNTGSNGIVMEDDGFTLDIAATSINGTGNTFIYMAFK